MPKAKKKPIMITLQTAKATSPKKTYWAIKRNGKIIFDGTFKECWSSLTTRFSAKTLKELRASNIEIARMH